KFDMDEALQLQLGAGYRANLEKELSRQINVLKSAISARKDAIQRVYNSMPLPEAAALEGKTFAIATTEKVALSDIFTANNMRKAETMGVVNCFIYGDILRTEDDARSFLKAAGYDGDLDAIKFINGKGLAYEDVVAEISKQSGVTAMQNIGIRAAQGELGPVTIKEARLLEIQKVSINGVEVVAAINSYQTLLKMVTTPADLLEKMIADGQLPPGVSYDNGIFKYLPKVMPIDYGRELSTYWNAIKQVRAAA
ncbi:MAG: hypothetical protein NC933_02100, partial [Candidatus Omnitrophica bacterium]|nr:hypothetical protein [Candidatus Omnitrophota bacterium]